MVFAREPRGVVSILNVTDIGAAQAILEALLHMRCSHCGKKAGEVVAVPKPRPRGVSKDSH